MNGLWLAVPFLAVRFLLPLALGREALRRAARFAPMRGGEKIAYAVYRPRRWRFSPAWGF